MGEWLRIQLVWQIVRCHLWSASNNIKLKLESCQSIQHVLGWPWKHCHHSQNQFFCYNWLHSQKAANVGRGVKSLSLYLKETWRDFWWQHPAKGPQLSLSLLPSLYWATALIRSFYSLTSPNVCSLSAVLEFYQCALNSASLVGWHDTTAHSEIRGSSR